MTALNTNFVTVGPVGSDLANQLDVYIRQDAKAAINERLSLEHYNLETGVNDDIAAGGQGRHKAGYVGVFKIDTKANIQAISGAGIGAVGLASDTGELLVNSATGWEVVPFGAGPIYATDEEAAAGLLENVAINPKQLQENIAPSNQYLHVQEVQVSGTDGSSVSAGDTKRIINKEAFNNLVDSSVDTTNYTITLPSGSYKVDALASFVRDRSGSCHVALLTLRDNSDDSIILTGLPAKGEIEDIYVQMDLKLRGFISITESTTYYLNMYSLQSENNYGFASSQGDEIYLDAIISKIG